jgi:hypothetical protein
MTGTPDLHLVLKVDADGTTLVAGPTGWHDAQNKWAALDEARRSGATPTLTGTYYMVRSLGDPAWAHLAPRLYPTPEHAARAIARRLAGPGAKARDQRRAIGLALGDEWGGWHTLARHAKRLGAIVDAGATGAYLVDEVVANLAELAAERQRLARLAIAQHLAR